MMQDGIFTRRGKIERPEQSLPLGNGEIGANVWTCGHDLFVLLSKTDAWSELGRLLKVGLLRIRPEHGCFNEKTVCRLDMRRGELNLSADGIHVYAYVDANAPVCRVEIAFDDAAGCSAEWMNYREKPFIPDTADNSNYAMNPEDPSAPPLCGICESADQLYEDGRGIGQFHRNSASCYEFTMKRQMLDDFPGRDPLLGLTFGAYVRAEGMLPEGRILHSVQPRERYAVDIFVSSKYTESGEEWMSWMREIADSDSPDRQAHRAWWERKWQSSYIRMSGSERADKVCEGYTCQRYLTLCAGRGRYPVKFNGSLFTCHPSPHTEGAWNFDYRNWGSPYWIQNTRLIYWNMLYAGDYREMLAFFRFYMEMLPVSVHRAARYGGWDGAIIPETMTMFGAYANRNFGDGTSVRMRGDVSNRYIRYHFEGELEIAWMMLCFWHHTGDRTFLEKTAFPFAEQVLRFFLSRFEVWDGKLLICPTSALETWQYCADDLPTVAGLKILTEDLLRMEMLPETLDRLCRKLKEILPEIPTQMCEGERTLAPCRVKIDTVRRNVENPELYAVFPFDLYGVGKPELETARAAYRRREATESCGWQQHGIQAARLGLSEEAAHEVFLHYSNTNPDCIFPAFWGPNYDWTPDQDNGCSAGIALTQMLVQTDEDSVRVFPAWPAQEDVSFRLPIGRGNFLEAELRGGQVVRLHTDRPETRKLVIFAGRNG